jgi:hypothetical protein
MNGFLEWITSGAQPDLDWGYALITLVFRFVAVFFVLWLIQLGMQLSARVIRRIEAGEAATTADRERRVGEGAPTATPDGIDAKTIAAIGVALELDSLPEAVRIEDQRGPSAWSLAGRAHQLTRR